MTRTTCRDVALALATRTTPNLDVPARIAGHLAKCPKCVAFDRQLVLVSQAARHASEMFEQEPAADFEERLLQRLCS